MHPQSHAPAPATWHPPGVPVRPSPKGDRPAPKDMDKTSPPPVPPAALPPTPPAPEPRVLGEYRILRRLGEGGMGAVYLGYHKDQDRQVAIKVLGDHLVNQKASIDRFYREGLSGTRLDHPNIVRSFGAGQDQTTGKHYLVLEFVDGPSAHALLEARGPLPVGDAVHIALDIALALEHAHSRNIIHRDIKPDNILLTRSGVAKLADLGLAKQTDEVSHLTATRQGFGTTAYMPYEQAINARYADGRSDIYALGATLYHLLTGAVPFPGENHLEVVEKKRLGEFPSAGSLNPLVPRSLDRILNRMLAKDPRDRYQTASELIIDLERSRLAAAVPSFADPASARGDPWVQARAVGAEPTRPAADAPVRPPPPSSGEIEQGAWTVRFRQPATGRVVKARVSTPQLLQRLKEGRLPPDAEARRGSDGEYRSLGEYAEFRDLIAGLKPAAEPEEPEEPEEPSAWPRWLLVGSVSLGLLTALLLVLWRCVGG
jgi:eukaryotic-like serine/threonine-protein kinase